MPPTSRNYYEILGVTRDATAVEIHRAYRSLARQYHPDVNSSADARARFAELSGAYEVLHDPEQRVRYDRQTAPAVRRPARPGGAVPTFTAERRARQVPRFLDDEGRGQQLGEPAPAPWRLVVVWDLPLRVRARFGPARGRGV